LKNKTADLKSAVFILKEKQILEIVGVGAQNFREAKILGISDFQNFVFSGEIFRPDFFNSSDCLFYSGNWHGAERKTDESFAVSPESCAG